MRLVIEGMDELVQEALANLRANVGWLRRQQGLTYFDLAMRSGMSEKTVRNALVGPRDIYLKTLLRVADGLGADAAHLFADHKEFKRRYAGAGDAGPLALSRATARSRSSLSSEARRQGSVAAGSGDPEDRATRSTGGGGGKADNTGVSPLCQPSPVPKWPIAA